MNRSFEITEKYRDLIVTILRFVKMSSEESNTNNRSVPKLMGRLNYDTWKTYAKSFLVIKGLWACTQATLDENASAKIKDADLKAWSEINLLVHESVLSYIIDTTTAKDAWDNLQNAFEDSGLCRKVELLKQLVQLSLSECDSVEDYINQMTMTSLKVTKTGLKLDDELLASLMLAGLPTECKSLVMAIENSTAKLTLDYVKTLLLQEPRLASKKRYDGALLVKSVKSGAFKFRCHNCGEVGHMAKDCSKKNGEREHEEWNYSTKKSVDQPNLSTRRGVGPTGF